MSESKYEYLGQRRHPTLVGRSSRSPWELAVTHRQMILQLLPGDSAAGRSGTLCVLGAGQCHDLNLESLLGRFHEVHLVDWSQQDLDSGVELQKQFSSARVRRLGGRDITGVRELLDSLAGQPNSELLEQISETARRPALAGLGQFDVVLSADVLPELLARAVAAVGDDDSNRAALVNLLTRQHLETVLESTLPGGQAVLVTGVTDSIGNPELAQAPANLAEILKFADSRGSIRPGCHPAALDQLLKTEESISGRLERYDISPLWIRTQTDRTVLYVAYRLVRRSDPPNADPKPEG